MKYGVVGEKHLLLALNTNGEVVVTDAFIKSGQGGYFSLNGAGAVAHVHYAGIVQKPYGTDDSMLKRGRSSFVIGAKGGRVWELGRINKTIYYRNIKGNNKWKKF